MCDNGEEPGYLKYMQLIHLENPKVWYFLLAKISASFIKT